MKIQQHEIGMVGLGVIGRNRRLKMVHRFSTRR
jgi:6-phosphogluconate dehydrogenase